MVRVLTAAVVSSIAAKTGCTAQPLNEWVKKAEVDSGVRAHWPQVEILVRAGSHCTGPEDMAWCETDSLDDVFGLAAARIAETKSRIKIQPPSSAPDRAIWHLARGRLPRLVA